MSAARPRAATLDRMERLMPLLHHRSPTARAERLARLLERPCTIHDQFCRCDRCKPSAAPCDNGAEQLTAILCMLAIAAATCLTVLH